ncbi:MAG: hypothetical protein L0H79_00510 [Intrasporangium sp.]|uniref:FAD-linked oxidase C-terminal domain-containing protein n=1 Tax=Intrasporangium sp. TaxID=1925024 RepID=UPI002647B465|nr:FAD-linked oxidase C-terminal domain-containing protein [Intrasporangium sp.]MDN5794214.1 hypothetical protein [Intrasporangium sp.]
MPTFPTSVPSRVVGDIVAVLELGSAELARQRRGKAVFDPSGIMNPGTVFTREADA